MAKPGYAVILESAGSLLQDRVKVIEVGETIVIAVADGAGGIFGSEQAAEAVVAGLPAWIERGFDLNRESTWIDYLGELDESILRAGDWGQTTAVVLAWTDRWVCGASVGDSEAWLTTEEDFHSLTSSQVRKPFLGCGGARIVSFRRSHPGATLVVGSDGLFKYAPAWKICETARAGTLEKAAEAVLGLVRLRSGSLQDDIGFVVARSIRD